MRDGISRPKDSIKFNNLKKQIIISTLFLIVLFSAKAQNKEVIPQDTKVGLVLSGGGAKGLAHIGALKVIDSLGIRIDYIGGTSMGAIIGSLYASGYSGKQLDSIFKDVDFDNIISDNLPREAKTFYERENSEKYAIVLPIVDYKVKLPSALSRGQNTYGMLSKLTLHVNDIDDFSKLPIPFFCIATDVETGKPVILDKGSLAQSVMASGAFPSLFQPVMINDQILIDGGVVNNYPIDELRAKGVDIIIGVDVQDDLATRKDLTSAPEILLQINNFRTIKDMQVKSQKTDVYIKPNIEDFNVVSFGGAEQLVSLGVEGALKQVKALQHIAVNQNQASKTKEYSKIVPVDSIKINEITIKGNKNYTRAYILGKLKFKASQKVSYSDFSKGVNNLVATNNFDNFLYDLKPSQYDEGYNMNAVLRESPKTTFLKLGIHYDDLYKSSVLINLTKKRAFGRNDVASFDFVLGDNVRYNFEYYIDNGFYWSVGIRSRYDEFNQSVAAESILTSDQQALINVNKLAMKVNDFTNQFYLQTLFSKDLALTLGLEHKRLKFSTETILANNNDEETVFEKSDYLSLFGKLKFDTYNDKHFPTKGFLFDGDFHTYFHSSDFNDNFSGFSIAKATIGYSQSFGANLTANLTAQGGFRIGEGTNPYLSFALGGYGGHLINNYTPFFGYDFLSLTGNSFVKSTLTLDYEIFKKNHINMAVNVANVEDNIFDTEEWFSAPDYTGYALGYSIETFIGPIEAKYSWSPETEKGLWFFNIGFWF